MEKFVKTLPECCLWGEYILIFVCLGTKRFSFDRLVKKLDDLVENRCITEEVIGQIGHTNYTPKHFKYERFMSAEKFEDNVNSADLILTHGGTGAIVKALKAGKQTIAIPRLEKYYEHSDDHQLQIVDFFESNGYVSRVDEMEKLEITIKELQRNPIKKKFKGQGNIVEIIDEFIIKSFIDF